MNGMVSLEEFAKSMNTSLRTVQRYIKSGHFEGVKSEVRGRSKFVDYEQAAKAWKASGGVLKSSITISRKRDPPAETSRQPTSGDTSGEEGEGGNDLEDPGGEILAGDKINIAEAQRIDLIYAARLKKQKFEREAGILIEADKVKKAQFEWARTASSKIRELPERTVDFIMAAKDREEAIIFLEMRWILFWNICLR